MAKNSRLKVWIVAGEMFAVQFERTVFQHTSYNHFYQGLFFNPQHTCINQTLSEFVLDEADVSDLRTERWSSITRENAKVHGKQVDVKRCTVLLKSRLTNPLQYFSSADRHDCVGCIIYASWLTLTSQPDLKLNRLINGFISSVIMLILSCITEGISKDENERKPDFGPPSSMLFKLFLTTIMQLSLSHFACQAFLLFICPATIWASQSEQIKRYLQV